MIEIRVHDIPEQGLEVIGELDASHLQYLKSKRILQIVPIKYNLNISLPQKDLIIQGSGEFGMLCVCDKCLEEFVQPLDILDIIQVVPADNDIMDISEQIIEEALLVVPEIFHCQEDCQGLCTQCGINKNLNSCECTAEKAIVKESPWGALDNLDLK